MTGPSISKQRWDKLLTASAEKNLSCISLSPPPRSLNVSTMAHALGSWKSMKYLWYLVFQQLSNEWACKMLLVNTCPSCPVLLGKQTCILTSLWESSHFPWFSFLWGSRTVSAAVKWELSFPRMGKTICKACIKNKTGSQWLSIFSKHVSADLQTDA